MKGLRVKHQFWNSLYGDQFTLLTQLDQYQYLGNCPPTPTLSQQQSTESKLGLMLG